MRKKAFVNTDSCVACGACVGICPLGLIKIVRGMYAVVDQSCVGCKKCAGICPASAIVIKESSHENE